MRQAEPCIYQHVENDIHLFTFNESSSVAVDYFFDVLDRVYQNVNDESIVRVLMDVRQSGFMPLSYAFRQGRQWMNKLPSHPKAYIAVVHKENLLLSLMEMSFKSMRLGHLTTASFKELEPALQWLANNGQKQDRTKP